MSSSEPEATGIPFPEPRSLSEWYSSAPIPGQQVGTTVLDTTSATHLSLASAIRTSAAPELATCWTYWSCPPSDRCTSSLGRPTTQAQDTAHDLFTKMNTRNPDTTPF